MPLPKRTHHVHGKLPAFISDDYAKYGLRPGRHPETWEDGMRSETSPGLWEWWYFDCHLHDGSTIVVVFYTKDFTTPDKPLDPLITIEIDRPDGTNIEKRMSFPAEAFSASTEQCEVVIGTNYFRGNLEEYEIHFSDEELTLDIKIDRTTDSWRQKTGVLEFGDGAEFFGWVVPVPQGTVRATVTHADATFDAQGSCYHDHNWGNVDLAAKMNHWYWGRAEVGPYTFIVAEIITEAEYDAVPVEYFNLARDGRTVADENDAVTLYRTYGRIRPEEGVKPTSDGLRFVYDNPDDEMRYEVSFQREKTLLVNPFLDQAIGQPILRTIIGKLTGMDGAYHRFTGEGKVTAYRGTEFVEEFTSQSAVWELMYFGKPFQ